MDRKVGPETESATHAPAGMTMKVAPDVHTTSHNHIFGVAKSVLVEVVSLLGSAEGCCRLGFNGEAAKPPSRRWAGPWDDCRHFYGRPGASYPGSPSRGSASTHVKQQRAPFMGMSCNKAEQENAVSLSPIQSGPRRSFVCSPLGNRPHEVNRRFRSELRRPIVSRRKEQNRSIDPPH